MAVATIHPAEVAGAIAAKTLTGIKLFGPANLIAAPMQGQLPLLQPGPAFISNIQPVRDSYGGGGVAQMTITYDLGYRYFHKIAKVGITDLASVFNELALAVSALYAFFLENDVIAFTGGQAVDLEIVTVGEFGTVRSPNETEYWGFDLPVRVKELIN